MLKPLFEIYESHLENGMRGYPVGYCSTSRVSDEEGLFYGNKSVREFHKLSPEEVIYLFMKDLPSVSTLDEFKQDLYRRAVLDDSLVDYIESMPISSSKTTSMSLMQSMMPLMGDILSKGDYIEDGLDMISKMPELVARVINRHAGWGVGNVDGNGYMERFFSCLRLPGTKSNILLKILKIFNVLHYDHGGGNLSVFVGKCVASSLQNLYSSFGASMAALGGPRHGRANQDALNMLLHIHERVEKENIGVKEALLDFLSEKGLLYGFGHAVLRVEDPRATCLYDLCESLFSDHPILKTALKVRVEGTEILKDMKKVNNPYPNVDAISGTTLYLAGFVYPEYYTILFGLARAVGVVRQIIYERVEARSGKGLPIIRPKYIYRKK